MSDPIRSISQNNFILADQKEVSHDNTLSGNGTEGSPLGVVPGYDETVLWSGSNNSTFTLNTPASAYEYIDIQYRLLFQDKICCKRFGGDSLRIELFDAECGDKGIWMRCNQYLSNNYLTYNVTQPGPWTCGITTEGPKTQSANQMTVLKVIGINRK